MTDWIVTSDGRFHLDHDIVRAAIGKSGDRPEAEKTEGDGATPLGRYALRHVHYRADRGEPPATRLTAWAVRDDDGWCDDPGDPAYNRLVRLPYPASCETLIRDDELYDLIVVLGHNDSPPVPGAGSAIFLHCARPGYPPTQGCVALAKADLLRFLSLAAPGDYLDIRRA